MARLHANLPDRVEDELGAVCAVSGLSRTDAVRRAISLYALVVKRTANEDLSLAFYDERKGEVSPIHLT